MRYRHGRDTDIDSGSALVAFHDGHAETSANCNSATSPSPTEPVVRPHNRFAMKCPSPLALILFFLLMSGIAFGCAPDAATSSQRAATRPDTRPAAQVEAEVEARAVADAQLLDELSRRSFRFFWEQAGEETGLVADRARADGTKRFAVASTASTGFGLTALCVADERGWLEEGQAIERVRKTLRFIHDDLPHVRGFYHHFIDIDTGARAWESEVSSIDTALLLAGVLHARAYFDDAEIDELATAIYERVDWPWMTNGGDTLSMGWTPESGFIVHRWDSYSELFHMLLMAIGSPTHPLPASAWDAVRRDSVLTYGGFTYVQCHALFTHQYPWAWVDVDGMRDDHMNYFENSRRATLAQRQMAVDYAEKFPGWGADIWGLTSCDGPEGYRGWQGGPPLDRQDRRPHHPLRRDRLDRLRPARNAPPPSARCTTATARKSGDTTASSTPSTPIRPLGPAGEKGWVSPDVIGIDVGITLLMLENNRDGIVWRTSMKDPDLRRALDAVDFRADVEEPVTPTTR